MKKFSQLILPLMVVFISSCSNKELYHAIHENRMNNCIKLPPPRDEQCKKSYQKSYDEYKRQREEVLKDSHNTQNIDDD